MSRVPSDTAHLTLWGERSCRTAHEATLTVLRETGVVLHHAGARALCERAGARVDGHRVYLPGELVEQALASAPRAWPLKPRGGVAAPLDLTVGPTYFGTGPDCMYVRDPESGQRRRARLADVTAMADLAEKLANVDFVMSMALPEDADAALVDVVQFAAMLRGTRKPIVVSSPFAGESLAVMRAMAATCGEAESFACLAMSSPPLALDGIALDKTIVCAQRAIPLIIATSPSAGSTGPASVSSLVVVSNAEILAGLVVHQLAAPGAPFVYGTGVGVMNMRTAVETYMPPGTFLGNQAGCDMAAHYGLPSWSYAGCSDSKLLDEQGALELSVATVLGALSRATLLHDVGYLESGMQSSPEAMVLGDELAGYARALLEEVAVTPEALALDEIAAVGPAGSHLGRRYTRENYRRFWLPQLLDQAAFDRWQSEGGTTLGERVRTRTLELLAEPAAARLDDSVAARLEDVLAEATPQLAGRVASD